MGKQSMKLYIDIVDSVKASSMAVGTVQMLLRGDFLMNGKYLFEVGGESKEFNQIAGIPDSYLAIAGIETGYSALVP